MNNETELNYSLVNNLAYLSFKEKISENSVKDLLANSLEFIDSALGLTAETIDKIGTFWYHDSHSHIGIDEKLDAYRAFLPTLTIDQNEILKLLPEEFENILRQGIRNISTLEVTNNNYNQIIKNSLCWFEDAYYWLQRIRHDLQS